ncbi:MAG TPA: FAD-dependent oxidoreductase, partial [Acidimicrobiales bacterium]|nr:FAD-dependent oxidoreductase [Acidimicrobiales bacterium]
TALDSPLLRGMYDLVFGYEGGDPARPRFSAGLGLQLATKMLLGYSGAPFWKMQAGMGEVIFAPLYQVLRDRGVEFRFFHRVDALRVAADGRSIAAVDLGVQAEVAGGGSYDPLIRVKDLPCWPDAPLRSQLRSGELPQHVDLESFWSPPRDAGRCTLEAGKDFDAVVFAISLGMVPHLCGELLAAAPAWRSMVDNVGVVATQAFQLWLSDDERDLGWSGPPGVTMSGFVTPFDTWASMSHLLPTEEWPDTHRPQAIAYFCSVLAPPGAEDGPPDTERENRAVRDRAHAFLDRDVATLWPAAVGKDGFRWSLLCEGAPSGTTGDRRLETQYWRANIDPSDLYVQSLPGTDQFRLQPGRAGFTNLALAGDWTDCGLNAGCVEAATRSGRLAARAVREQLVSTSVGAA